jgi:molybdate transport system ATP-binding protein
MESMNSIILRVDNLQVTLSGKKILRDISMEIKAGEQWAVSGEAGSGKTVLAHTLAGHHFFQGHLEFPDIEQNTRENAAMVVDFQHRFRDLQNLSNFYYQQRYNAFDSEATTTVAGDLAVFPDNKSGYLSKTTLLEIFQLTELLDEPLIQLSNGENKRLQILKGVLCRNRLLILDEPFTGLDVNGRQILDQMLTAVSNEGQSLLYMTSRFYFPSCINRFANLEEGRLLIKKIPENAIFQTNSASVLHKGLPEGIQSANADFKLAVSMHDVHIRYGDKHILKNINWQVEKGACWSLTGPNGAGKSTLLSLITADNPQAYANDMYLFDRKRGSGESIWEIKQRTGFLSPELQLYFDPSATAFSAIASGLFDTIGLFRVLNEPQEKLVWEWLHFLDAHSYARSLLSSLPAGLQRLILLARAMIKNPPLLVLDEPCQGLDDMQTSFVRELINDYCNKTGAGLIYVSHYMDEFPACIRHHLRLKKGEIV